MGVLYDLEQGFDTKMRIVASVIELGKINSIDRTTTMQICEAAGVSRQTFYRYFKDKYDVVQWYNLYLMGDFANVISNGLTWEEGGLLNLHRTHEERDFYRVSLQLSKDVNSLYLSGQPMLLSLWTETLRTLPGFNLTPRLEFQLKAWTIAGNALVIDWVMDGFRTPVADECDLILSCMPQELKKATDGYVLNKRRGRSPKPNEKQFPTPSNR